MFGYLASAKSVLDAAFAAADRLEGRVNLYLWRVMK
jgi:hypothetical protein